MRLREATVGFVLIASQAAERSSGICRFRVSQLLFRTSCFAPWYFLSQWLRGFVIE